MVILLSDIPEAVSKDDIRELVQQYHPTEEVDVLRENQRHQCREWKVELGKVDREVANYVIDHIKGHHWHGCAVNAYCPLFQER